MVSYITIDEMVKEIGESRLLQLTDDERTGVIDEGIVTAAIESAESTFNAYARTRYALPVPATQLVKKICKQLARYELESRRATSEETIARLQKTYYTPNLNLLKDVQAGKAGLDIPATAESTVVSPDKVLRRDESEAVLRGRNRETFSDAKLRGF